MTDQPDTDLNDSTPYTWESRQRIALHFSTDAVQSIMRKDDPWALEIDYTKMMMSFLPVLPEPADILVIGLGGGSLSKFCYRHLPEARITTLEINPAVIALRETFHIPADDDRFRIIAADAADWLRGKRGVADVILLDAYMADGMPPPLTTDAFVTDCLAALRPGGILCANLWRRAPDFRAMLAKFNRTFDRKVLRISCDTGNEVMFAFHRPDLPPFQKAWKAALSWQGRTGLNLPGYLEDLVFHPQNTWFYNHV